MPVSLIFIEREKLFFDPPFDHPEVIVGQASVGFEILKQCNKL
jgi:threonine dehydratase